MEAVPCPFIHLFLRLLTISLSLVCNSISHALKHSQCGPMFKKVAQAQVHIDWL